MINIRTEWCDEVTKKVWNRQSSRRTQSCKQTDRGTVGQTDGAGPTSSISWLQEGMAGKMQQNLRGRKNVQSFQNHRGRSRDMSKQNRQQKGKVLPETLKYYDETSCSSTWMRGFDLRDQNSGYTGLFYSCTALKVDTLNWTVGLFFITNMHYARKIGLFRMVILRSLICIDASRRGRRTRSMSEPMAS